MKKLAFVAFALTTFFTYSQTDKVIIGDNKKIDSKILNEKRKICISLPKSYNSNSESNQKYPVIYLLDGENNFPSVAGMLTDWTGTVQSNYPEMIVVGIINIDRNKDYTPTHAYRSSEDSLMDNISGGGEKFTSFLEKELIPYINENYSTDSYNVLIGHSLGGLFVVNTLLNHTQLFNAYIAIDPSLWWDNKILVKQAKEKLSLLNFEGISLYMGIANTIDGGYDTSNIQNSTIPSNLHPQAIFELDKLLKTNTKLNYQSHYYDNEDHNSVGFITKVEGLAHIFKHYKLRISDDEFENIDQEYVIKIENHYKTYSTSIGHEVKVPESFINEIGYSCLNLNKYDAAKLLFEYNIKNYPLSGNCYDSYGDYFVEIGNIDQAIIYFEKALTLSNIPETKKKLKAFKKRK